MTSAARGGRDAKAIMPETVGVAELVPLPLPYRSPLMGHSQSVDIFDNVEYLSRTRRTNGRSEEARWSA